ncbi:trypsin-like peptidase domain-containing protein [Phaeobacter marinintestinus]|uniref:trypsin-like peptidase domain-containing protein n=1 Tax=Falsiphaeobacter marinintestinus TaxID=1492905 RepID=UPI0011B40130|nr:trypsin-like peptidase domain-containing protein [Phaeobacter marinintestinus]
MFRLLILAVGIALAAPALSQTQVPQSQSQISLGFAPLVKQAAPAVVNIYAKIVRQGYDSPFSNDPFFRDFFRGFGTPQPRVQNSLGSGVILSDDGIVVSNYHVVGQATDIRVVTNDRKEYTARVILGDQGADLAILQLEEVKDLPYLRLRNSDHVEVGELVLAIGNPFGVGQTVSSGIVSGLARTGAGGGQGRGYFIQTDAPINPGNSGGALIDVNGDLIGINTRIVSRSGGSNGIGFAIPANLVAEFVHQARAGNERFELPWAGMAGQPVDSDLAASMGLDLPEGIVISDLHADSPFLKAGFAVGDVITEVDGLPVNTAPEMIFRMTVAGLGNTAQVTRATPDGSEQVAVPMIAPPDTPKAERLTLDDKTVLPGLSVARVNPAVIAQVGLPLSTEGVVVIDPGAYGARAGFQPGDVLLTINKTEIDRTGDVRKALTKPGRWVQVDLMRRGGRMSMRFRL